MKRLLAFSTVSHVGLFICGIGLLSTKALAGVALYIVGHGFTKAALFMAVGVLLHRFRTVDEFDLHGQGRPVWPVGVVLAAGGLLLAALPPFTAFRGKGLIEAAGSELGAGWLAFVFIVVSACTGGAVLRVAARVFLGWGPAAGPQHVPARAAHERVDETRERADRTPWLMVAVPAVLLGGAALVGLVPGSETWLLAGAAKFTDHQAYPAWVFGHPLRWPAAPAAGTGTLEVVTGSLGVLGALVVAAFGLFARPLNARLPSPATRLTGALRRLHSGHIGDYIAWWTAGAAAFSSVCLLVLH